MLCSITAEVLMLGRDRILATLAGQVADRVPIALGFFSLDLEALAPQGAWRDDLVDVLFVDFPVSPEEEALRRRALPFAGDARLGTAAQAARYERWSYRPASPKVGNPLERAETLADLERFPFPEATGGAVRGRWPRRPGCGDPRRRPGGRRKHATSRG